MSKPVGTDVSQSTASESFGSFHPDAYLFVRMGLSKTMRKLGREKPGIKNRHVSGQELAGGLRDLAIRRYGLLARTVLSRWGIYSTLDFGRVVYELIEAGQLSKSDEDSIEDFRNVYDFRTAFHEPPKCRTVNP